MSGDAIGYCIDCSKPCTEHDLVADWYWCEACRLASLDRYIQASNRAAKQQTGR